MDALVQAKTWVRDDVSVRDVYERELEMVESWES